MKKRILNISLILALASTGSVFAQQGFGTNTPDKSAAVDITASNKGLLIPRIALQSDVLKAPITNPTKSLMVYNTTVNTTLKEGFYFWNGTKWEWFTTASNDLNTTNVSLAVAGGKLVLTDSDGQTVDVNVSDINTDNQQIETFEIGTNNVLTLTLEDGGTKTVDLAPYFNSTKLATGLNTTIDGTGTVTAPYKVNVAIATTGTLGVVKIGSGINVTNGEISVPAAPGETTTVITDALTGTNKHKIADYKNETINPVVDIYETVTALTQDGLGISYQPETGAAQNAKVVSANTGNLIKTDLTDFGALLTAEDIHTNQKTTTVIGTAPISVSPAAANATGNTEYTVSANVATASTVGVIIPGNGLSVDGTGKLDVSFPTIDGTETKLSNGTNTTIDGNGTTTTPYKVDVATGNGRTLGVVREVETNPTVNVTNGDLSINLTNTVLVGEVTGPLNATIVADDVIDAANLKTNAVTTVKILNANVTPIKIEPAAAYTQTQVMVTGTDGVVKWVDQSTISPTTTHTLGVAGNTLTSTVNGVSDSASILNDFSNALSGTTLTTYANDLTAPIDLAPAIKAGETLTSLSQNTTTGIVTYQPESGPEQTANVLSATAGNVLSYNSGVFLDKETIQSNQEKTAVVGTTPIVVSAPVKDGDTSTYTVSANNATATAVGVVKPGTGLTVDVDGTLNAADNQQLSYDTTTNVLTLERGGDPIDLSALTTDTNSKTIVTARTKAEAEAEAGKLLPNYKNYTGITSTTDASTDTATYAVEVKNAMPKFFYMPSVIFDTSTISINDEEMDLYAAYLKQFTGTGNPALISSELPAEETRQGIPVLAKNELEYYVTYYDSDVFEISGIDADGNMTYKVKANATGSTYINIVFVVK